MEVLSWALAVSYSGLAGLVQTSVSNAMLLQAPLLNLRNLGLTGLSEANLNRRTDVEACFKCLQTDQKDSHQSVRFHQFFASCLLLLALSSAF